MVAGARLDLMLVIAADDGVMPQTREHLDILKLLQSNRVLPSSRNRILLTRVVELVQEDIRETIESTLLPTIRW